MIKKIRFRRKTIEVLEPIEGSGGFDVNVSFFIGMKHMKDEYKRWQDMARNVEKTGKPL